MEEPRSPRPLERLASMRADRVAVEKQALAAAQGELDARRAERDAAKLRVRQAERQACAGGSTEGRQPALEALLIDMRRVEEARGRVRLAKADVALVAGRLEHERAQERAALAFAGDRARAVARFRQAKEQDELEEAFRVRPRDET